MSIHIFPLYSQMFCSQKNSGGSFTATYAIRLTGDCSILRGLPTKHIQLAIATEPEMTGGGVVFVPGGVIAHAVVRSILPASMFRSKARHVSCPDCAHFVPQENCFSSKSVHDSKFLYDFSILLMLQPPSAECTRQGPSPGI